MQKITPPPRPIPKSGNILKWHKYFAQCLFTKSIRRQNRFKNLILQQSLCAYKC